MDIDNNAKDMFQEISNIGSGNAFTALSQMLGDMRVSIGMPKCDMIPFNDIAEIFGGPETIVVSVLLEVHGDIDGMVMLVQGLKDAVRMTHAVTHAPPQAKVFSDMDELIEYLNPINEIANIMLSTYINAIASMTNFTIKPEVPRMTADMALAIMTVPAAMYGQTGESAMLVQTDFSYGDNVNGKLFLVPTVESYNRILSILNG